jgi:hypothetical protein
MKRARSLVGPGRRETVTPGEGTPWPEDRLGQPLDEALEETFPAGDPAAVTAPGPHDRDSEKA